MKKGCYGTIHTEDGYFPCRDSANVVATWEGAPFDGQTAYLCAIHAAGVEDAHKKSKRAYPGLKIRVLPKEDRQ